MGPESREGEAADEEEANENFEGCKLSFVHV